MVLVKGSHVRFVFGNGRGARLPPRYGMFHDPSGAFFSPCEVWFGAYSPRGIRAGELSTIVRKLGYAYFGRGTPLQYVTLALPETTWHRVGEVSRIYYRRYAKDRDDYFHDFQTSPVLTTSHDGNWFRLVLPQGCVLDDRGYVWP